MIDFYSQSGMYEFLGNPVANRAEKCKVLRKNFRCFLISCFVSDAIVSGSRYYSVTLARVWRAHSLHRVPTPTPPLPLHEERKVEII
jgi:hypothetical protein